MKCYFCDPIHYDGEAHGQCHDCGRFVCRGHSKMVNGIFVCAECAAGGQDTILKLELEDLARISSKCDGCGKSMVPDPLEKHLFFDVLTPANQQMVREKFSKISSLKCPNGCKVGFCCFPKKIKPTWWSRDNYQCSVCGNTFYVA